MWEFITDLAKRLFERIGLILIILGVAALFLGFAKGIGYNSWLPIPDEIGRWGAIIVGAILFIAGFFFLPKGSTILPSADDYGVKISYPAPREPVAVVNVTGTSKKKPPEGYTLMILRIYPETDQPFVPLKEAKFSDDGKTWYANGCDVGGQTGDDRTLGAYMVGRSVQALLKYYETANAEHRGLKQELLDVIALAKGAKVKVPQKRERFVPRIFKRTDDMIKCHEVHVTRK
jgi:hypothetical protein